MKYGVALVFCITSAYGWCDEKSVQLQYLPNTPVVQTSRLQMRMNDALPGFRLQGKVLQTVESIVTVMEEHSELPLLQPPLDLTYILKKIDVEITANHVKGGFSSEAPHRFLPLSQNISLIDRPIRLHIDSKLNIENENSDLNKLFSEFPALRDLHLEGFFLEWMQHLFALAGKEIVKGKSYKVALPAENLNFFQYTITAITEQEIHADLQGLIEKNGHKLKGQLSLDGMKSSDVELSFKANVKGHIAWDYKNALICQLETQTVYTGILSIAESIWNLGMSLDHHLESKPSGKE